MTGMGLIPIGVDGSISSVNLRRLYQLSRSRFHQIMECKGLLDEISHASRLCNICPKWVIFFKGVRSIFKH